MGISFLIAPFPDLCLLVPSHCAVDFKISYIQYMTASLLGVLLGFEGSGEKGGVWGEGSCDHSLYAHVNVLYTSSVLSYMDS